MGMGDDCKPGGALVLVKDLTKVYVSPESLMALEDLYFEVGKPTLLQYLGNE